MGNHYIPKFYLKRFIRNNDNYINCFEKGTNKIFKTNIINIAQENNLYTKEIENYLTEKIEQPCVPVFDKITKYEKLTKEDKLNLVNYILLLYLRRPEMRENVAVMSKEKTPAIFERWKSDIIEYIEIKPEDKDKLEPTLEKLRQVEEKLLNDPKLLWWETLNPELYPLFKRAILNMNWTFYEVDKPRFITCDKPVFFFTDIGLGRMNSELSFPISCNILLWAQWGEDKYYKRATEEIVYEMNRRTVYNAIKNVFVYSVEPWMEPFIKKANHRIHKLVKINKSS